MKGRKTGGRKPGTPNKSTTDVAAIARALVEDEAYRDLFRKRLYAGEMAPGIEQMLWHYAWGKPKELLEHSGTVNLPSKVIFELHRAST